MSDKAKRIWLIIGGILFFYLGLHDLWTSVACNGDYQCVGGKLANVGFIALGVILVRWGWVGGKNKSKETTKK